MLPSVSEQLTLQFYDWEQRGRGWYYHKELPIELEPPFVPFFHYIPLQTPYIDDGKRPSIFGRIAGLFKEPPPPPEEPEQEPIIPYFSDCTEALKILSISVPKGYKIDVEESEQLLLMLSGCRYPISFEVIACSTAISLQFACRESDAPIVQSQVKAFFPNCIITEKPDQVEEITGKGGKMASIVHFGLKEEFMRPLSMAHSFNPDPFIGIFGSLDHLQEGQYAICQILFQAAENPWAESIIRSVTDSEGSPFFSNAPDMVPLAKEKISSPLFAATMRIMGVGSSIEEAQDISYRAGTSFGRIYASATNSLIPIYPDIDFQTNVDDCILRDSHLMGMLLNTKELATFVHLPSDSVTTPKLIRDTRKTKQAPQVTEGHKLVLGINEHQGKTKEVSVSSSQRLKHTHVIGATGTGKSTFLLNLISQDIQNGEGIAVLDPHGDLIESILAYIPESRIKDVVIIDPADGEYPVGFNILSAHSEIEKDILSSDLVAVFKRLSTSWGDQMNSVFANAILAILESNQGGTLVELRRFLVEKGFREAYLKSVSDPSIIYYWQKEFPLLKSGSIGPILTRLDTFLRPKLIRNMVAQKKGLDFENILDSKKILLVKLSQGLIGNENSYLLGTFFVTKIYQAAMARQIQAKEARSDFFLYIDEFQNFITPSMSLILSGARKYHLGLILAHQDMQQLVKYDSELASAVVSNAGTRICFRLGDTDAKRFAGGFSFFEPQDLENLNTGEAIARVERPEYDFSLTTVPVRSIDAAIAEDIKNAAINKSREIYGTPKLEVEAMLRETMQGLQQVEDVKEELPKPKIATLQKEKPTENIQPISLEAQAETVQKLKQQKEQTRHRYLQTYIKKMAESRGYISKIEEPTPDGSGRVDISLERNGRKIAVEICNTTEPEWELHNIQKCLAAGYDLIIACSDEKKTLENIRQHISQNIGESGQSKILFLEPKALTDYLDTEIAKEASTETRIKGWRVKVDYNPEPGNVAEQKKNAILKAVSDSVKKKK